MPRILIVDDEESICWGLSKLCAQMSIECDMASSAEQGLALLENAKFDAVIMDIRLPGMDGLVAIECFHQRLGKIPIIIITAFGDLQTAIDAVQKGAFEYIVKPFELVKVQATIRNAMAIAGSLDPILHRIQENTQPSLIDRWGLIGSSAAMQDVYRQIALATTSISPVLITGESGTGKELTARSIHRYGARAIQPFVAVNIASLSPSLAESELFGHAKGAFTGADSDRLGLIPQAHGGTLFLDEIADIPLNIQVKLLRMLDLGEVTPVGSNTPIKTDFRLISATHQDLWSQVNRGEFRHDLYYRLRTFEIQLPALRNRREDIPELVQHFLAMSSSRRAIKVSADFIAALMTRPWHGNVRELQNVVARATTFSPGGIITAEQLDDTNVQTTTIGDARSLETEIQDRVAEWTRQNWQQMTSGQLYESLLEVIDQAILPTAFELSENQYSAAARKLGIHRTTLKRKLTDFR